MSAALRAAGAAAMLALAGCGGSAPGLRDSAAPFAATTRFSPAAFAGDWYEVAAVSPETRPAGQAKHRFAYDAGANRLLREVSAGPGPVRSTIYGIAGPGRLKPADGPELWVLWVDEGFRTAVLGRRDGAETVILDRSPAPAPDRLAAAKEILAWYGYDMTALKEISP